MIFKYIPLEDIYVDLEDNYRTQMNESSIRDLHKSFVAVHERTKGARWILNPVDVVKLKKPIDGKPYRLLFGFRRYQAARLTLDKKPSKYSWAGQIPAMVREEGSEMLEGAEALMALIENIQREAVNPLDEANACQKILDETGLTMSKLGASLGRSKGWVSQRVSLLKLGPEVQGALASDKIEFSHARELGRLGNEEAQNQMLNLVDMNGWDARETKHHVKSVLDGSPTPQTKGVYEAMGSPTPKPSAPKNKEKVKETPDESGDTGLTDGIDKKRIREATDLVLKVAELEESRTMVEDQKKGTESKAKKAAFEQQSAFFRGAQLGISYALGAVDDITVSALVKGME